MASGAPVLSDRSLLSRLDQAFFKVEEWFALASGLVVLSLMFLAVVSASGRNFFNSPLPGYVDWIEFSMPFIAILGVSYCHRIGGHIRMDLVIGRLHGRVLWMLEAISTAMILLFMLMLCWGSWSHFERAFDWESPLWSRDSSLDIGLPLWPAKLIVPLAFSVFLVRAALHFWGYIRAFVEDTERPVALPLPIDIVTQAAQESASVSDIAETNEKESKENASEEQTA